MLDPAIGKLIENYENRYKLVIDVAKQAREIAKNAEDRGEIIIEKTVSLAIDKLAKEKELI